MRTGKVYLIGAGPGDYKLITLKGLECIETADVVLYDRLINEKLLRYAKEDAELIYVGKAPDAHAYTQEEINKLLIRKAMEGKVVARLKGGDPFVFGRGGEEALALQEMSLAFEIVPGVTSAVAVPAYAGIPVTHRNISSSLHVITGHEDPDKEKNSVNYEIIAKLEGTVVFLMGIHNIQEICESLMKYGQSKNRPAAVIMNGTTASQRAVVGTLGTIQQKVEAEKISNPAIIVIGEVVSLSENLSWFEKKPLFGKKILVTRTREQASSLTQRLEDLGGEVIEFPTIQIKPPENFDEIDKAIGALKTYKWVIFSSVNGVNAFFDRMKKLDFDFRLLHDAKICAIGPITAKALEDLGFTVEYIPEEFRAEAIIEGLKDKISKGDRILLPRADIARELLENELTRLGAMVDCVHVYRTVIPEKKRDDLIHLFHTKIDIITFTSSSTVKNFIEIIGKDNLELLKNTKVAVIGPITEGTARQSQLHVDIVAEEYTIDGLVTAILKEME